MSKQPENNRLELTKSLLRDYMKNNQVLQKEQAGFLYEIAADSIQDNTTLTQLYIYGGVVYPVANFNGKEILKFTPSLIEKILHKGYQDEQEDAYIYLMKQELILEKNIHMAGFREQEVEHEC